MKEALPGPVRLALFLNYTDRQESKGVMRRTLALNGVMSLLGDLKPDDEIAIYTPEGLKGPLTPPKAVSAISYMDEEWNWGKHWGQTWRQVAEWLGEDGFKWAGCFFLTDCAPDSSAFRQGVVWLKTHGVKGLFVESSRTARLPDCVKAAGLDHLHLTSLARLDGVSKLGEVMRAYVLGKDKLITEEVEDGERVAEGQGGGEGEAGRRAVRRPAGRDHHPLPRPAAQSHTADRLDLTAHDDESF